MHVMADPPGDPADRAAAIASLPVAVLDEGRTHWHWSRAGIAQHLIELATSGTVFIAGIDHGFSFPLSYFERYGLTSWDTTLDDFQRHWPTQEPHTCVDFIHDAGPTRVG